MARKGPRIPRKLAEFDDYIKRVPPFLDTTPAGAPGTNGARLGLTTGEITTAKNYLKAWFTGDPLAPGAYELHTNPDTKTKATRLQVVNIMKNFGIFFRPLLDRISGSSAITSADRLILNIAEPGNKPTIPQVEIVETVYFEGKSIGGGKVKFVSRTSHDTKRASRAAGANAVRMAFKIGDPAPAHFNDGTQKDVFPKAIFIFDTGSGNTGKKLYVFLQWYNTSHPDLAGPWSEMGTITIL